MRAGPNDMAGRHQARLAHFAVLATVSWLVGCTDESHPLGAGGGGAGGSAPLDAGVRPDGAAGAGGDGAAAPADAGGERGRVRVVANNVVADNGRPLRGEAIFLTDPEGSTTGSFTLTTLYDETFWQALRDDFHLNAVRLFIMRPPQNWSGGPGADCWPPTYRCYPLDYPLNPPDTALNVIDDAVDLAARMGMYIIVDYHPVGGYDRDDAVAWWTQIAPRYRDRTHVLYELANEPVAWSPASYGATDVVFEEDLYQLIRSHAPDTHVILWTFANATGPMLDVVSQGSNISYQNASVGYHPYAYDEGAVLALRALYPVINTEIGADRVAKTAAAEAIGVSWFWLNGAETHGHSTDGFAADEVYWPADN